MGDLGSIPGLGRSPGEGKGYPLQYSDLENSMDCIVHGVAKSRTRLSDFHFHFIGARGWGQVGLWSPFFVFFCFLFLLLLFFKETEDSFMLSMFMSCEKGLEKNWEDKV